LFQFQEGRPLYFFNCTNCKNNKLLSRIIIVRGEPIFVDFVGHPYPRIDIPTNMLLFLYKYYLDYINLLVTFEIRSPRTSRNLVTHERWPPRIKVTPQYYNSKIPVMHSGKIISPNRFGIHLLQFGENSKTILKCGIKMIAIYHIPAQRR
jgi:hypothetical protein